VAAVVGPPWLDLNGVWQFVPDATNGSQTPVPIIVPNEYTLQGFRVPAGTPTRYTRTFTLPSTWAPHTGIRVKFRADGIYSLCTVTVNGQSVGGHLGGFTPFELDVTDVVVAGSNRIAIDVTGSSLADTLAAGAQYAAHDLGGITRKVYLLAVPEVSVSDVWATTTFTDSTYTDAWLNVSRIPTPFGLPWREWVRA
jgi:beta-galactosidase/beta-glucuronidase